MSFILESIKQAERERKLGQQAPSISIEYSGEHVDDIENGKKKWMLLSLALFVTAIVVWGATYYFANKDRQFMSQYAEELALNSTNNPVNVENQIIAKVIEEVAAPNIEPKIEPDIEMVPVKNVHKSKLKSVKVISADEEAPKTKIVEAIKTKKLAASKNINRETKPVVAKVPPKLVTKSAVVSNKQDLATIYSDLAELAKQEPVVNKPNLFEEPSLRNPAVQELVQIEEASYVAPPLSHSESVSEPVRHPEVTSATPEHAVSTGVPSFGELPHDVQANIPDFNVSVHMFHADPTQRRIRINGQMYTEGKSLQQDLALLEITRYGAVFDYQGHKFRLNVR